MLKKPIQLTLDNEEELNIIKEAFERKFNDSTNRIIQIKAEMERLATTVQTCGNRLTWLDDQLNPKEEPPKPPPTTPKPQQPPAVPAAPSQLPITISEMTKARQAELALKNIGRPASTRDMLSYLLTLDQGLIIKANTTFDKYQKALAATLYQKAVAKITFSSHKDENGSVTYSLLEWEGK